MAMRLTMYGVKINKEQPERSFAFRFENMGPDDIRDLNWYASISGIEVDVRDVVRGHTPMVAKGDVYHQYFLTSAEILERLTSENVRKATGGTVCMTFSGNVPGVKQ